MKSYDGGHRETQTVLPDPLASTGFWNVGTFALPASLLSWASVAVFAIVFGFFEIDDARQELFVLPFPGAALIGMTGSALAWWIAAQCQRRPGRMWPRIWALILACLNSSIAVLGLIFHDRSRVLALAVAGLAAAATLAPRLVKLRPNSPAVQYVAPLSVLMILLVILPSSCAARRAIGGETEKRVDRHIQQFRIWTTQVKEITGFEWSRMEDSPEAAAGMVAKLKRLRFEGETADSDLWRSAVILGKDDDLALAMQGLTEAVVAGFTPARVPRVSELNEAAIHYDQQQGRWQAYSRFSRLSGITGEYHQELGRLFAELTVEETLPEYAKAVEYGQHYAGQRQLLQKHLTEIADGWADNWAAFRVPQHGALIGRERATLDDLLRRPFMVGQGQAYAAGSLLQLMSLPLYRIRGLSRGAPGCDSAGETENGVPGCRCQQYPEGAYDFFRLDCYSYTPQTKGRGAELRIEMRIVYQSASHSALENDSLPQEVFFHFLIPEGEGTENFREQVMTQLAATTRESLNRGRIHSTNRSGSVSTGFRIVSDGTSLQVYRPEVVALTGVTPEPRALKVRVERTRGPQTAGRRFSR